MQVEGATAPSLRIAGRPIGPGQRPYVIAELSGNHNGDIGRALALIDAVHDTGADAVKLQTYTADTITIDHDGPGFIIKGGLWDGRKLHDLYNEAHTPWEWHEALFERAHARGLHIFSSPFDLTAVDFLESLDVPAYKIASFEIVDIPLIRNVANTGKPMIISTGIANLAEIGEAVDVARAAGAGDIALLHCVSGYPAPLEQMNLRTIPDLARRFGTVVGLSDHSKGIVAPVSAIALGATIIEKHITLRRADGGPDAEFSLEPEEFAEMVRHCHDAAAAAGSVSYTLKGSEAGNVAFRRSLYAVADIAAGEPFTHENVRSIRPGFGLPPKEIDAVLMRKARRTIARGTPLSTDLLDGQ